MRRVFAFLSLFWGRLASCPTCCAGNCNEPGFPPFWLLSCARRVRCKSEVTQVASCGRMSKIPCRLCQVKFIGNTAQNEGGHTTYIIQAPQFVPCRLKTGSCSVPRVTWEVAWGCQPLLREPAARKQPYTLNQVVHVCIQYILRVQGGSHAITLCSRYTPYSRMDPLS